MGTAMSHLICSFHSHFRPLKLESFSNACNVNGCSYFLFSHLKGHNTLRSRAMSSLISLLTSQEKCTSCADLHWSNFVLKLLPLWDENWSCKYQQDALSCDMHLWHFPPQAVLLFQSLTLIQGVFSRARRAGWHFCLHLSLFLELNHAMWF